MNKNQKEALTNRFKNLLVDVFNAEASGDNDEIAKAKNMYNMAQDTAVECLGTGAYAYIHAARHDALKVYSLLDAKIHDNIDGLRKLSNAEIQSLQGASTERGI